MLNYIILICFQNVKSTKEIQPAWELKNYFNFNECLILRDASNVSPLLQGHNICNKYI